MSTTTAPASLIAGSSAIDHTGDAARPGPSGGRRQFPIGAHAAALALVLLAFLPIVGTHGIVNADEGAAIVEAQQVARGHGWITPYAFASIDHTQEAFPFERADVGARGRAAFVKHPGYVLLLAGADRMGGVAAMFVLSVLGTVLAAFFAALLADLFAPGLARPSLWFVGLASPLLFDGYQVLAHSCAAACAALATWGVLRALESRHGRYVLAACLAVMAGTGLRSEFLVLAVALGVATLVHAVVRRDRLAVGIGVGVVAAAAFANWCEHLAMRAVLGRPVAILAVPAAADGWLDDRVAAVRSTLLSPGGGTGSAGRILVLLLVSVVTLAVLLRARPRETPMVVGACLLVTACALALVAGGVRMVPGLLVACPLLGTGLALLRWRQLERAPRLLLAVVAGYVVGIVLTQYAVGGGVEWGGRYFALALPLACPLVLLGLARAVGGVTPGTRALVVVSLVLAAVAPSVVATRVVRREHRFADALVASIRRVTSSAVPGDGGKPVVVSRESLLARESWPLAASTRFLLPPRGRSAEFLERLTGLGIREVVVVGRGALPRVEYAGSGFRVRRSGYLGLGRQWCYAILRRTDG
ncbi:MAG: hypothetical protein U0V73_11365 [Acidimicrobiia bacterium]